MERALGWALLLFLVAGCGSGSSSPSNGADGTTSGQDTSTPDATGTGDVGGSTEIPSGAFAMFPVIVMSSRSDSLPLPGGTVSWSSTDYGLLRYVPDVGLLDVLTNVSSQSYANSYLYPLTRDGHLYGVRCSIDTQRKILRRFDPRTGSQIGECSFYSDDLYSAFAVLGDKVYYRSKEATDLYGNRTSGGDIDSLSWPCSGAATTLVSYAKGANKLFYVYASAARLFGGRYNGGLELREIDTNTGAVTTDPVVTVPETACHFSALDDALYYGICDAASVQIYRLDPADYTPTLIATLATSDKALHMGMSQHQNKLFVALRDTTPKFYLIDLTTKQVEQKPLNSSLFGTKIYANGAFLFVD
ncbi:MAG: hypothetical protein KC609_27015 [Myxococcales bacterium]|nr:hypothetical protein [Myxococcales bacterium]